LTSPSTYILPVEDLPVKKQIDWNELPDKLSHNKNLITLLESPTIANKRAVYEQYDHSVQTNTVVPPGLGDAAVIRIKGTNMAIAATTDCNSDYCKLDPYTGAALAVYEAARNLLCVGAEPLAITDCLNFGNPKKPDRFWYFQQSIKGIITACKDIGIPVISGNVSFYNEKEDKSIKPTPAIGMIGLIKDVTQTTQQFFKDSNHAIVLIGSKLSDKGFCSYLKKIHNIFDGPPPCFIKNYTELQKVMLSVMPWIESAHDCSDGGIAVALAECCLGPNLIGAQIVLNDYDNRHDLALFHEGQNRIIISCEVQNLNGIIQTCIKNQIDVNLIGWTGGDLFQIRHNNQLVVDHDIQHLKNIWELSI
jgi:phosphoribosylformylglycinamidine synthase